MEPSAKTKEGSVPDYVELIPAGREIRGRDGRCFINPGPECLIRSFKEDRRFIPIDINHASEVDPLGSDTAAVGWITDLLSDQGALWGFVEWNVLGVEKLRQRQYRYMSPAFVLDETKTICAISSVALVVRPNLKLAALNTVYQPLYREIPMTLTTIKEALHLEEDSDADRIVEEIRALQSLTASQKDLSAELEKTKASLNALQKERKASTVAALIEKGIAGGHVLPAQKELFLALCQRIDDPVSILESVFQKNVDFLLEQTPQKLPSESGTFLNTEEKALLAQIGLAEERYLTHKKAHHKE